VRRIALAALAASLSAALALWGCGPKAITVGSRPFPADKPVFRDASGNALPDLPSSGEPVRLVLIDFPWCPPCSDAWKSVGKALEAAAPGSVRVYRILFDREMQIAASGKGETSPMRPVPPPWPESREDAWAPAVTTLAALPDAFRERFRVGQAPVLLLIEGDGTVARRWVGYSTDLEEELSAELRRRAPAPSGLPRR
jgi:hypothetical protein